MIYIAFMRASQIVFSTRYNIKFFDAHDHHFTMREWLYCQINEIMYKKNGHHICECEDAFICLEEDIQDKTKYYHCDDLKADELVFSRN